MTPERWAELNPRLDELLDLPPEARAARLDLWREADPALADELAQLLAQEQHLAPGGFMTGPALPALAVMAGVAARPGDRFGAYTLDALLGEGGMGSVWSAHRSDGRYQARVAIKFLRGGLLGAGDGERFAREGAILAQLDHPHIARLLDAGVAADGRQPYLVLEHVDGEPVDRHVQRLALGVPATLRLFGDVLDAVAHAHNRLVLHRDLKPSNILVDRQGRVKLLDFGIARLLHDGDGGPTALTQRLGGALTPQYAAPEQFGGGELGTATDVYALGVLLYQLLGGGHPTPDAAAEHTTPLQRMKAVIEQVPRRLSDAVRDGGAPDAARRARQLRGDLDTIVATALHKAPAERYANAAALAEELRRWLAHQPIVARPPRPMYVAARFVRRHRWPVVAASAALLALGAAVTSALNEGREARRQRDQAEGLIEFMLGDLRQRLRPVGRLDVLDAVGTRVLSHYAADVAAGGLERLDADALGRRARALHLVSELAEQRGRLAEAAQGFDEAARSTAQLLAREPGSGQRVFEHAQSVYWLGYIARRRGQLADTERHFSDYLALAERLHALDPTHADWRLERAYAQQNLGIVRLDGGRASEALPAFDAAREVFTADAAQRPATLYELANTQGWIAQAHQVLGNMDAERLALRAKIDTLARVPDLERSARAQRLLAGTWRELGVLAMAQGEPQHEAAAQALGQALQGQLRLVERDGDNLDWLAQATLTRLDLAELARGRGDLDGARGQLALARPALRRLLDADADKLYWQVDLQGHYLRLAASVGQAETIELAAYANSLGRRRDQGQTLDWPMRRTASGVLLELGHRLQGQGRNAEAVELWQQVQRDLADAASRRDLRAMCLRALALLSLGQVQAARGLAESLDAAGFRHPLSVDLRRRLAAIP